MGVLFNRPRMMRLTAQYADIWNGWLGPAFWNILPNAIRPFNILPPTLAGLDAACRARGRDPATVERSIVVGVSPRGYKIRGLTDVTGTPEEIAAEVMPKYLDRSHLTNMTGTPAEIADQLAAFVELGISHIQVILGRTTPASLEAFAPTIGYLKARVA
jgi:alkanesulfonate monooxygenase SsuD/methylene tetrahydromethanopterin reductase-like flavin-dependent oxidoreductase (luciferase family)